MENTIEYRGYTINIEHDDCAENPFTDYDCEPPIVAYSQGHVTEYGATLEPPVLTTHQIKKYAKDICEATNTKTLLAFVREYQGRYFQANATDLVNDAISEYFIAQPITDQIDKLPLFYEFAGIVALAGCTTGYCQGNYADVLVVASPEYLKDSGATITSPGQLNSAIDLYGAWAWGDVYYYTTTGAYSDIQISACGGFYGSDHDDSGLIDAAKSDIDYCILRSRHTRLQTIKALIKAKTPLALRAGIIDNALVQSEYALCY